MKNVIKIFVADLKRISTNVVAVVIIMGLCILPSLYAWFNILSNWDPYGPSATKNLKIAVYTADEGIEYAGVYVNVGEKVVDGLKENSTIGWVFTDTEAQAVSGVDSGEYYAALVIPEDFSKEMVSFISGELNHPNITYYENEKKNAIAPKITGKAKTAVQEEINSTFISTITEVTMELSNALVNADNKLSIFDTMNSKLRELDGQLNTYISIMDSFIGVTNAVSSVIDTTNSVIPDMNNMIANGEATINAMQGTVNAGSGTVDTVSVMIDYSISSISDSLDNVSNLVNSNIDAAGTLTDGAYDKLVAARAIMPYVKKMLDQTVDEIYAEAERNDIEISEDFNQQLEDTKNSIDKVSADLDAVITSSQATNDSVNTLRKQLTAEINLCKNELSSLRNTYDLKVRPAINETLNSMGNALTSAQSAVGSVHADFSGVTDILNEYNDVVNNGTGSLTQSRDQAVELEGRLSEIIKEIDNMQNDEDVQNFEKLFLTNPEQLASFMASPVLIKSEPMYEIENYGSAMSPFYTILALWVGSLILVAILKVKVLPIKGLKRVLPYQKYFGRYITFYLIGQIQALITVMGDLKYIGIQCRHPFLFWLAASMCSFVFSIMIYSLTVAFENVGEALAVVVMVIQVAGAGGTFPVEVLPKVYQAIYKFLPFTYGMNAMKETIGGMYGADYWKYMGILMIFAVISIVIGLVVAIPFRKINHKIEESKEETGLML